jgi:hypothetical protein
VRTSGRRCERARATTPPGRCPRHCLPQLAAGVTLVPRAARHRCKSRIGARSRASSGDGLDVGANYVSNETRAKMSPPSRRPDSEPYPSGRRVGRGGCRPPVRGNAGAAWSPMRASQQDHRLRAGWTRLGRGCIVTLRPRSPIFSVPGRR